MVGDIATMNQGLISGEIDFHLTGGTYSVSPGPRRRLPEPSRHHAEEEPDRGQGRHRLDRDHLDRSTTPTSRRWPSEFLDYVQAPDIAHTVAFAEGTYNPVAQMGNQECFDLFTKDELDAIQWDSLEEEMGRSAEYDIVPDYDAALDLMTAAKRARG